MEAQLQYKFDVFEGPLDLLLSLISKNKIDIYDIQISELLDQYMEQIAQMRENRMDIASEFLTMASRLVYIKSVMLLPKYEEEAEELKKELTGQPDIVKGYISAVGRGKRRLPPSEQAFSGIVAHKIVSVNSRIIHLMRRLRHGKRLEYHEIFEACDGKSELVATFLATLELVKGKRVRIEGEGEHAVVRMIEGDRE